MEKRNPPLVSVIVPLLKAAMTDKISDAVAPLKLIDDPKVRTEIAVTCMLAIANIMAVIDRGRAFKGVELPDITHSEVVRLLGESFETLVDEARAELKQHHETAAKMP